MFHFTHKMIVTSAIAVCGLACTMSAATAALVHQYTFDSGSTAIDSVGGADGTLFGGAQIVGGELVLNGRSAYVETIGQHIIPVGAAFTLSIYALESSRNGLYAELISQGFSGSGFYIGHTPTGTIRVTDANPNGAVFPNDHQYHQYALSFSPGAVGNDASFYIDGILVATYATIANTAAGGNTRFGRQFLDGTEFFAGSIDDVSVYDTALTAEEIAAIHRAGSMDNEVSEPGSLALLGLGLLGLLCVRRRG